MIHLVNAMDDLIAAILRGESAVWPAEALGGSPGVEVSANTLVRGHGGR